jgi:IS30 family transposase
VLLATDKLDILLTCQVNGTIFNDGKQPGDTRNFKLNEINKVTSRIYSSTWAMVNSLIKHDWSSEQISGRLFKEQDISISHESIYLHIYQDKYQGGNLHKHLRCQKKRRIQESL